MKYEHGISAIDTGFFRPQFDASHLIVEQGRAAFVDVGTNYSVPGLLAALSAEGLTPADVDYVILTHVHLDHAGGAGMLMRELPNAQLIVHPRGARHMIDPAQLIAGATAVYGPEEVQRSYGDLIAVPEERVVQAGDGFVVDLAGRLLLCLDTPGHARHHICIFDERSRSFFTGDTFGLSYREFDTEQGAFIIPTSTPVQFEPDAMRASIERMLTYSPEAMFLTHYSRVTDVPRLAENLIEQIQAMVDIANANSCTADRHVQIMAQLAELYLGRAKAHGCSMDAAHMRELLAMDIELNAQGLEVWLDRKKAVAA
ncbi:MBL fold metallo-hydrolase [Pseudolysobacter antarcticus]|uniref:MBL fold metallo-hydrolase n=1 Tax=Pseudolysobacter antarcticus TaxID=2511995 RepID=A0A411HJU6_9GAMM|nr:MBL fold metallo-hydrolase [Pseudolysobacter antarcticus]QBB70674.1 MBL fold metallo-hydrolase [Pseudolysobacter antarcticus]